MHDDRKPTAPSDQVPDAVAEPRPYGKVWRGLAVVFVVLVCICGWWVVTSGLTAALFDETFDYLLIATILLGAGLAWPVTLRRLNRGVEGDARNAMERTRSGWFMRPGRRG